MDYYNKNDFAIFRTLDLAGINYEEYGVHELDKKMFDYDWSGDKTIKNDIILHGSLAILRCINEAIDIYMIEPKKSADDVFAYGVFLYANLIEEYGKTDKSVTFRTFARTKLKTQLSGSYARRKVFGVETEIDRSEVPGWKVGGEELLLKDIGYKEDADPWSRYTKDMLLERIDLYITGELPSDLKQREIEIINRRLFLTKKDGKRLTFREIGEMYNVSPDRIRQIYYKGVRKLNKAIVNDLGV